MWKWVKGYEGKYKVSDNGEVFSVAKRESGEMTFRSLTEAENAGFGFTVRGISSVLCGKQNSHRGYKFKVVE